MAKVWGPKSDGSMGVMTREEIIQFALDKTSWRSSKPLLAALGKGADTMMNHKGSGGGTSLQFRGNTIFHSTEQFGEATFFFTCANGEIASIIGIGDHAGKSSETHTYRLAWKTDGWKTTPVITT
jgi:hypothetical protein